MNLTFLNPLFLFGLVAAVLPILIHRLIHRKAILRRFSAVRLLLRSQRMMVRPQRLKNLFLLCLRILAVTSLVFMMAQPVLTHQGLLASGERGAKVVILDNSPSMSYREENGERYTLAKKAARHMIEGRKGQIIIIPTVSFPEEKIADANVQWMSPEEAVKELETIPISFRCGDPGSALALAYRILKDVKMPKEILVISDMAWGDWEGFSLGKLGIVPGEVDVKLVRMSGPKRDPNLALKGVRLVEGEAIVGVPSRLEVTISNFSEKSESPVVEIYLSGVKGDQKSIELKAGEDKKAYFELSFERSGWVNGEIRLSGDRLPWDDVFYFALKVRDKIRVLVVDGDPKRSLRASESYYLVHALRPGGSEASPFLPRVITEEELENIDLRHYEAIFLLNVARPQGSKLASFLESSRPLFLFLGDRTIPEEYNNLPLFPLRIGEVIEPGEEKAQRITQIDRSHAVLKSFAGSEGEGFKTSSFRRYFKIEGNGKKLLTLGSGDPLLVETGFGKGKLILFSSSADLDWNDFALKGVYLPLIQGLLKEAVGLNRELLPENIRFGDPVEGKAQFVQVLGPKGGPGIYQLPHPSGEKRYGVNIPIEESDLSKISDKELKKRFGTIPAEIMEYEEGDLKGVYGGKRELWPLLLAFLLIVLGMEMVVANGVLWRKGPLEQVGPEKE